MLYQRPKKYLGKLCSKILGDYEDKNVNFFLYRQKLCSATVESPSTKLNWQPENNLF